MVAGHGTYDGLPSKRSKLGSFARKEKEELVQLHFSEREGEVSGCRDLKYVIIDKIKQVPRSVQEMLRLTNLEIDNIQTNYTDNIEERKYQVLLLWEKKIPTRNSEVSLKNLTPKINNAATVVGHRKPAIDQNS